MLIRINLAPWRLHHLPLCPWLQQIRIKLVNVMHMHAMFDELVGRGVTTGHLQPCPIIDG